MRNSSSLVLLLLAAGSACGRESPDEGAGAVRALLDSAAAVHGAGPRLAALGTVSFRLTGERIMVDQSRRADPPWDREPSEVWIIRDGRGDRWFWQSLSSYPGLGAFGSRRVVGAERAFELDPVGNGHGPEVIPLAPADSQATRQNLARFVPGLLLESLRDRVDARSRVVRRGTDVVVLATADHRDRMLEVHLDPRTHALLGYTVRRPDPVYGDVVDSVVFRDYRDVDGLHVPTGYAEHLNGQLVRELGYAVQVGAVAESLFAVPPGYYVPDPEHAVHNMDHGGGEILSRVAAGVYVDQRSGAMVLEFADHLAVFDCPNDYATSQATLDAADSALGGKPVRYLIASHTHPDHCGGARPYFQAGATVISAAGHADFYRRLAAARHTLAPDAWSGSAGAPRLEPLAPGATRELSDGSQSVLLLNVGPSPHSEETLIALVRGPGLLWQVDLFLAQMTGPLVANRPVTDWLARELERRGLGFERIMDTHIGATYTRAQFNEALRRGGYRELGR